MPVVVQFLTSNGDLSLMVDFHKSKSIVRANTALIDGIYLDDIPPGVSGFKPGLVLIHRNWKKLYFVNDRVGWEEDDYFRYAIERLTDKGIVSP